MIPLFKTHYSIGKSILTAESILNIAKDNNLKEVVVVEDSFYGFRSLNKTFKEENIKFIFGIRLPVVQNHNDSESRPSKLIFFAKNNNGVKKIKSISLGTDQNLIPIINELCDDTILELFIGKGIKRLTYEKVKTDDNNVFDFHSY